MGRRSQPTWWSTQRAGARLFPGGSPSIGAEPPTEELEDCGFVYFGRHFRSQDGTFPAIIGPPIQHYGSISVLLLPADNGTWSTTLVASAGDEAMRAVARHRYMDCHGAGTPARCSLAGRHTPRGPDHVACRRSRIATGASPEPKVARSPQELSQSQTRGRAPIRLSAGVRASARSTRRRFATCWERTTVDKPLELAAAWNVVTDQTVEPWYRATLSYDRHRLAEVHAAIEGRALRLRGSRVDQGQDPRCGFGS